MPAWGKIVDFLFRFSVPVFVIISGFKFALSESRLHSTYFSYIVRRVKRLLYPYLLWTVILYFLIPPILGEIPKKAAFDGFPFPSIHTALRIIDGSQHPAYQLWFVPMLLLLTLIYPLVFRYFPVWISQPVLWLIFFHARTNHLTIPWSYPSYLVFLDLGARLSVVYRRYGFSLKWLLPVTAVSITGAVISFLVQLGRMPAVSPSIGFMGSELFVPLTIVFLCAIFFPVTAPRSALLLAEAAWPIFILHEPLVLGRIAWLTYITLGIRQPVAILLVVVAALLMSLIIYQTLKLMKIDRFLF